VNQTPDPQRFGQSVGQSGVGGWSLGSESGTLRQPRGRRTRVLKGVSHDSYGFPPVNNKAHLRSEMGLLTRGSQRFQTPRCSPSYVAYGIRGFSTPGKSRHLALLIPTFSPGKWRLDAVVAVLRPTSTPSVMWSWPIWLTGGLASVGPRILPSHGHTNE
jgi:hypothetical protein